ncbi:hypothetical protein HV346_21545 [Enterobacter sp. RHBSTW-00994]|uniref:hypothetical protein n=1 Tax=Enterobacteriaceae TaxID=543 RepID=UPI0015E91CC0|nr:MULTISPECIES: hypothetical protein [Enterobacteriaceae]MBM3071804.1 hypothetical protein [Lelliottia sp. RWM.1]QLR45093.1 hypothetical protein HV346_21545 [Enterobacter sp. RHBSTW-00994]
MTRLGAICFVGMSLLVAVCFQAASSEKRDPRDPTIWQEKLQTGQPLRTVPCEVESGPDCPVLDSGKSLIQAERERREKRAIYAWGKDKH